MIKTTRFLLFYLILFFSVIFYFPLCLFRPFNTKNSHALFQGIRFLCSKLIFIDLEVEGYEKIYENRPAIIVGNHQHTFDILAASGVLTPFLTTLGKWEIIFLPIIGQYYWLSGNILIKRENPEKAMKSMAQVERRLKEEKLSVLIFPEGHRNSERELKPFKKGAFHTAVRTGFPILPLAISQYAHKVDFNKAERVKIHMKICDPISTKDLSSEQVPELTQKVQDIVRMEREELNKYYQ